MTDSHHADEDGALLGSVSHTDTVPDAPPGQGLFPLVAIGASAGGLDACREFLAALPEKTGFAFLFVQHLDPVHPSLIAELLAGKSKLVVKEAVDGALIEPEHLYVIPPGTYLAVEEGQLQVVRPDADARVRLPFDHLLRSLAAYSGSRSMAVVLSGTGADGSGGLIAIHEKGGFVVVQKPEEAAYDGMPRSAVATGVADAILSISAIPQALIENANAVARSKKAKPGVKNAAEADDLFLSSVIALVKARTSHDFTGYKRGTVVRRMERRMTLSGIAAGDTRAYLALLEKDTPALEELVRDLLINVTAFFRDRTIFDYLAAKVIPDLVERHSPDRPIRIWIAGCSTGEEAYSLGILFREAMAKSHLDLKLQIFASDVDGEAIAVAREGFYPATIEADVTPERLSRFFTREKQGYRVLPVLRTAVIFAEQDLLLDPPFSRIDMVACRNLLIYLIPEAQAKAISLFHFALRSGGILLLGSSETVGAQTGRFETVGKAERVYRHVGISRPGELQFARGPEGSRSLARSNSDDVRAEQTALAKLCRDSVMESYAPAAVLVNRKCECLYFLGPVDRYLAMAPGVPTHDIMAMMPRAMQVKLRSALQRSSHHKTKVITEGAELQLRGGTGLFSMQVEPVMYRGSEIHLVCFIDQPALQLDQAKGGKAQMKHTRPTTARIHELELELDTTKMELNGAIRSLEISAAEDRALKEEGVSFNEEYQSTNEELMTSKEELQSLNEELTALNGQLQETLDRQRTTSTDLQNVLYSTEVATLFLDNELKIRFFTPATRAVFNVIPGDIGRPLADLTWLATDVDLLKDAGEVMAHNLPVEREIEATNGICYMRRILPYLGEDNSVEGVVITFVDVTRQRHAADALKAAKRQAEIANVAKSRFLAAASHDLRQPLQTLHLLQGLLVRNVDGPKPQKLLVRVDETLEVITGMLDALLDINQIETGIVKAAIVDFPVHDLLLRIHSEFVLLAQSKGLDLRFVQSSLSVSSDPHLLEQLLRNLLSNALKYTKTGKVLIGCRRQAGKLSLEVWDTGIGIPSGEIQAIFDEYHQIDNDARDRSKGLGLGLAIVQRLADLLGHRVRVRSNPGKGSVFAVEVPLAKVAAPAGRLLLAPPAKASLGDSKSHRTATILVIEDDAAVRELLRQLLTEDGHDVSIVADGHAAIDLIYRENLKPDLLLADYNLPGGMTGMATVIRLREKLGRKIPAIILTGDISSSTLSDIAGESVVRLSKPVKLRDMTVTIQRLLEALPPLPQALNPPLVLLPAFKASVFIIDDDKELLDVLRMLIEKHGLVVATYTSCEAFLADDLPANEGCLLVDGYLPGMNGLELLRNLHDRGRQIPSIMMTGQRDVGLAVSAMKAGVSDFMEKPFRNDDLLDSIDRALLLSGDLTKRHQWKAEAVDKLGRLTRRQREIMDLVLAGHPSKNIAADLKISQRTVENHRAMIMKKCQCKSLPALARFALAAEG